MQKNNPIIIVTGPTASGKTTLSEILAQHFDGEIINADVGQFYAAFGIGTAKPDWRNKPFTCHLFDIIDNPQELSVAAYKSYVSTLIHDIQKRGKRPIIVGGSLFYIKSLFFPPHEMIEIENHEKTSSAGIDFDADNTALWNILQELDPKRAQAIHPNDRYRIVRALTIWLTTGKQPSSFEPKFTPFFPSHIIFVTPDVEILSERINQRTKQMINVDGWIAEAELLINSPWEAFLEKKGMIGYNHIFTWLKKGKASDGIERKKLIDLIALETRQYAKRQMVFLKKFKQDLDLEIKNQDPMIITSAIDSVDKQVVENLLEKLQD